MVPSIAHTAASVALQMLQIFLVCTQGNYLNDLERALLLEMLNADDTCMQYRGSLQFV